MKYAFLFLFLCLFRVAPLFAADTLSIGQIRTLALQNSPLQQTKALAETTAALQLRNIRTNALPRIQASGQATWQSDVFALPIDNPLFAVPEIPKDQYKIGVEVSERLWDGGSDKYLRQQRVLEREQTVAQTDADVFQLRETVTDLFFKVLLLQESEAILTASRAYLQARLRQAEAAVSGGVSLRTHADLVRIQLLQTEQQISAVQADQEALKTVLAIWIGRQDTGFQLRAPGEDFTSGAPAAGFDRPEYRLFDVQQRQVQLGQDRLRLRLQPRVELFAHGGLGRPNPFNFFETGFEPFGLIGVRAVWTPIDWGNAGRERQALALQAHAVDVRRQAFDQRLLAVTAKDRADSAKARALLEQDEAIIALQEDIVRRAEAQVQNGIMTTTDYLAQLHLLTQARLARKTHAVQALQAREMLLARTASN
ncbi:MAG: TolC family protein [Saprospirales bacterium]|nr:TolC family protein [Saprospirales bacterium]MBK8921520.1 TolC family protein [Saprospirales bacterium]